MDLQGDQGFSEKSDRPILKGAYIEEAVAYLGDDQIEAPVNIKSKDELIGEIITYFNRRKNVVSALQSSRGPSLEL